MIIHQPEITTQDEHTIVWVKIELEKYRENFPEYLWYRVPNQYKEAFTLQSDAFLVPALLSGMYYGENIEVRGPVSPRLAYHLDEYQFVLSKRFKEYLNRVGIKYDEVKPLTVQPVGVGTTFSGGVDSLFTLWKHLPQNQPDPDYQITQVLFIKGFDLLHSEDQEYMLLYNRFSGELEKIGIDLIPMETNINSIRHLRLPASYTYGPTICGAGLSLAGILGRFLVPSSWDYYALKEKAYSADPWVDRLTSTDTLDVIHHGTNYRRVEKIAEIVDWELAQDILWVCLDHKFEGAKWNCSRCEKCIRTMIPIYALGKTDEFKTFAKPLKSNKDGLWWIRKFSMRHDFVSEMYPFVRKHKPDFSPWLRMAALFGMIRYWLVTNLPGPIKHWLRRYGYYVTRNEAPDCYEIPEITKLLRGISDHPSA